MDLIAILEARLSNPWPYAPDTPFLISSRYSHGDLPEENLRADAM